MVKKDEVIAKVKVIPDMGNLNAAENRVELASINMKQAETDMKRMKELYASKLVSTEEYEKTEVSYRQAKAELLTAKDALNIVREGMSLSNAKMSTTLIRSTIDGLILDIPVKVGNSVIQANTMNDGTTVATVADMSDLIFNGSIDETEVGALHEGMPMSITLGALPDYRCEAFLEYISPKAVEKNGSNQFEIKAALSRSTDVTIRSGYSANAEIVLQEEKGVLSVQESALDFRGDSTFVYLKTGEKQYESRPVVTGISDGIDIEIKSGLREGDLVRGPQQID